MTKIYQICKPQTGLIITDSMIRLLPAFKDKVSPDMPIDYQAINLVDILDDLRWCTSDNPVQDIIHNIDNWKRIIDYLTSDVESDFKDMVLIGSCIPCIMESRSAALEDLSLSKTMTIESMCNIRNVTKLAVPCITRKNVDRCKINFKDNGVGFIRWSMI